MNNGLAFPSVTAPITTCGYLDLSDSNKVMTSGKRLRSAAWWRSISHAFRMASTMEGDMADVAHLVRPNQANASIVQYLEYLDYFNCFLFFVRKISGIILISFGKSAAINFQKCIVTGSTFSRVWCFPSSDARQQRQPSMTKSPEWQLNYRSTKAMNRTNSSLERARERDTRVPQWGCHIECKVGGPVSCLSGSWAM